MNGRILKFDVSQHRALQELLPWYLAQTLDPQQAELVRQHVQTCVQCQADLDWQRKLCDALPAQQPGPDMEAALARLQPRLDGRGHRWRAAVERGRRWWAERNTASTGWMRWALALQALWIAVLLALPPRAPAPDNAAYHTLGSRPAAGANAVVKFRPDTAERELRRILAANGARVVDGPTVADAYLLDIPPSRRAAAIERMRGEAAVLLAEPLEAGSAP